MDAREPVQNHVPLDENSQSAYVPEEKQQEPETMPEEDSEQKTAEEKGNAADEPIHNTGRTSPQGLNRPEPKDSSNQASRWSSTNKSSFKKNVGLAALTYIHPGAGLGKYFLRKYAQAQDRKRAQAQAPETVTNVSEKENSMSDESSRQGSVAEPKAEKDLPSTLRRLGAKQSSDSRAMWDLLEQC